MSGDACPNERGRTPPTGEMAVFEKSGKGSSRDRMARTPRASLAITLHKQFKCAGPPILL